MMKSMNKKESSSGLHTIKNEKIPRVVKKRNGKTMFKAKRHRRRTQVIAMTSSLAILSVGIVAVGAIIGKAEPNVVDPGFVTVSYEVPFDGSVPSDHSALENIGYMNRRFQEQTSWYSEMHGSTVANTMGINVNQSVNTYKQFSNDTLIMADITTSSMVNKARQFCYQGESVIWRMGAGSPSTWPTGAMGDDCFAQLAGMSWQTGDPYGHMSLEAFTEKNGLPGTGFCVYVINEETLLHADEVVDNGDGTYSQTYYLDPATDKAPCHYVNQMVFTGDLPSLPVFHYITVTYTFDSTWQILRSFIDEQYTANLGVSATCTSAYQTDFKYNTDRVYSDAYDTYFSDYIEKPFIEPSQEVEISSLNCLTSAFSSVLTEPVSFDLSLSVNGKPVNGNVYVDVGSLSLETMDIRAKIGSLNLWLSDGSAYIEYGGMKVNASLADLMAFIGELTGGMDGGISLDTDSLLSSLANGDFTVGENSATLSSTLSLGIDIPVVFHFNIDEEKNVTLGDVMADISFENVNVSSVSLGDIRIGAVLKFGDEALPALSDTDKAGFTDIIPVVKNVMSLVKSNVIAVGLHYEGDGFAVDGDLDISVRDLAKLDVALQGDIAVTFGAATKSISLAYADKTLYLDLDGIKLKAGVDEAIALLSQYISFDSADLSNIALPDLGELFSTILSEQFASLLTLESENNTTEIVVKGTELLKIFGIDFALGDVTLSVGENILSASVLGADVSLAPSKNEIAPVNAQEYAAIVPYIQPLVDLFTSEAIKAELSYEIEGVALTGEVTLNLKELSAYGTITATYKTLSKDLQFIYAYSETGGTVYLGVDGLKIKAEVGAVLGVVGELLGTELKLPEATQIDFMPIFEKVLAFDFGKLVSITEKDNELNAVIYGNELLKAFGVEFALGNVELTVGTDGTLTANALGAVIALSAGAYEQPVTEGYVDITPYIQPLVDLFTSEAIKAELSYEIEGVALTGEVTLNLKELSAYGTVTVAYKTVSKDLQFIYAYSETGGTVYLGVDGLKIKAEVGAVLGVVGELLGTELKLPEATQIDFMPIIEKVLAFDFGKLVSITEKDNELNAVIYGNELLKAFGVEFALGNVELTVGTDGTLTANALGAVIALSAGMYEQPVTEGYVDITPIVEKVPEIVKAQSIAFAGSVDLTIDKTVIKLNIEQGVLSWANGLEVRLDLSAEIADMKIACTVGITGEEIALIVDGIAVRVRYDEFETIKSAVSALYQEVATVVNQIVVTGEEEGLLADNLEALMQKLGVADALSGMTQSFDISMLDKLVIGAPVSENAICTLSFGELSLELFGAGEGRYFGATVGYATNGIAVSGGVDILPATGSAQMPDIAYLGTTDFIELVDYISAALNTLTAKNLSVTFGGGTVSTAETENGTEIIKNYNVNGKLDYYSGDTFLFVIDTQKESLQVTTDLYLHTEFAYVNTAKEDDGIYLEMYVLDYDNDDVLDFFVTLSLFAKDDARYAPLKLYARADELMEILASACAMLKIDSGIINNYFVSKWINVETAGQMRALGGSLLKTLGVGDISSLFAPAAPTAEGQEATTEKQSFIESIVIGKEKFIFKANGFTLEIAKTSITDENGVTSSYLTGVGVLAGATCVDVSLDALNPVSQGAVTLDESYFKLEGIARLLRLLAASSTHKVDSDTVISGEEKPAEYALNELFYIDGTVTANLNVMGILSKEVNIRLVAISVSFDENDEIGINVRLEYDGVAVASIVAINGDTTVDLTLKNNMIYIKRVQTSYFDGSSEKQYPNPVTVYRVMPLASFGADVVNQVAFLLNFGSVITDNLPSGDDGSSQQPAETEKTDIGTKFNSLIKSCVYTPNSDGTCDYVLTINGDSLLKDMLRDIVVKIGTRFLDGQEVIYDLAVNTGIKYSVIDVTMNADLIYENPCMIPVTDKTVNIADAVSVAMEKALKEAQDANWANINYIEGQTTTVSYVLAGETIATQVVLFNSKTGECYANLTAPDAGEYAHKGYDVVWNLEGIYNESQQKYFVTANQEIYGSYKAKTYCLTLVDGDGNTTEFSYVYGEDLLSAINGALATENSFATSCSIGMEEIANGETEVFVVWKKFDFTVTYYNTDGSVFATQYYENGEGLAYPESSPTRVGYVLSAWKTASGEVVGNASAVTDNVSLYPVWALDESAEVTVRLYSDVRFNTTDGVSAFDPVAGGYYTDVTLNGETGYTVNALSVNGYQQMGWWYYNEETGSWSHVTDVTGMNGAALWAVWIKNIKVTVTNYSGGKTYTIEGKVEGGTVYGKKSAEIFNAVGMTETTTGVYTIYSEDGKNSDNLKYGKAITINYDDEGVGTFGDSSMTSASALFWSAEYGGIKITKTFSYGSGLSVSTENASYVSKSTYTVTFVDGDGNLIKAVNGVRTDYPYDGYDSNVYVDELAAAEKVAVPSKVGYEGKWQHTAVEKSITVAPVYTQKAYSVHLKSADGKIDYVFDMYYGETITAWNEDVSTVFTVADDGNDASINVFTLPEIDELYVWEISADTLSANSFQIFTGLGELKANYVRYKSPVAFTHDGASVDNVLEEAGENYTLLTPTAEGYRFLGWYVKENNAWSKFDSSCVKNDGAFRTYEVEALWLRELTETMTTDRTDQGWGNFYHVFTVTFNGGELIGKPYDDGAVTIKSHYSIHAYAKKVIGNEDFGTKTYDAHITQAVITGTVNQKRDCYVEISATFEISGHDTVSYSFTEKYNK